MPDDQGLIRERLGKLGLGTRREEEILRELGEHLDRPRRRPRSAWSGE